MLDIKFVRENPEVVNRISATNFRITNWNWWIKFWNWTKRIAKSNRK